MSKILVTGGCGYIGSHVTRQLSERGHEVIVFDNLSTGSLKALLHGERVVIGDLADEAALDELFANNHFDAIFHFAASIVIPDSIEDPLFYYENNTVNTLKLLKACSKYGITKFIFSSTAAVYGETDRGIVTENLPLNPANPYAASKAMDERILIDLARVTDLRYIILRYFNVAGAELQGRMGQRTLNATHLIKVACETAIGKRNRMQIFGTDYDTPDGTCIRDYIHIEDLADAHLRALEYLMGGGKSDIFNCGYGRGLSVKDVIERVKYVSQVDFKTEIVPARAGDVAKIIASNRKIKEVMGWNPKYDDINVIVQSAYQWEQKSQQP